MCPSNRLLNYPHYVSGSSYREVDSFMIRTLQMRKLSLSKISNLFNNHTDQNEASEGCSSELDTKACVFKHGSTNTQLSAVF